MMDTNELKRLLSDSCDELSRILDDCRSGPAENVRVVEVMDPLLQEFRELQDQVFGDVDQDETVQLHRLEFYRSSSDLPSKLSKSPYS